jgi:hypothetical protein
VEIDQVDRLLEKQTGLITRPKDSNLYVFHWVYWVNQNSICIAVGMV